MYSGEQGCGPTCLTLAVTRSVCFKALHTEQRSSNRSRFTYRPSGTWPHRCFSIKHHAANFIYPSWQGTLWQHTAHSVIQSSLLMLSPWKTTRKQTKKQSLKESWVSLLNTQALTEQPNTHYQGHMTAYCVRRSFESSSYCAAFLLLSFVNVS